MTTTLSAEDLQEEAREAFRRSEAEGAPLMALQLGQMFDRSDRWARERILEVRREGAAAGWQPTEPVAASPAPAAATLETVAATAEDLAATAPMPITPAASAPFVPQPAAAPGTLPEQAAASVTAVSAPVAATAESVAATAATPPARQPLEQRRGAWAVSWLAFVVGIVVSIAANVAHTFHPTAAQAGAWVQAGHRLEQWSPDPVAIAASAFWPIGLLLAVEVISRVHWQDGWQWKLARYGGTGLVALVAAVMSYSHMVALLSAVGESGFNAHLGPLAVDGLMVVAGFALLSMGQDQETARR